MTPLYAAVNKGNIPIIKLLLENDKIDVNYLNNQHRNSQIIKKTALYLAVEKGKVEIVKLLITNKNIDVNIVNENIEYEIVEDEDGYPAQEEYNRGISALQLAKEKGNTEIINLLQSVDNTKIINLLQENGNNEIPYVEVQDDYDDEDEILF